jgi:hypothetical protein
MRGAFLMEASSGDVADGFCTNFASAAIHPQEDQYEMRDRDVLRYCINCHNTRDCTGRRRAGTSEEAAVDNRDWATACT